MGFNLTEAMKKDDRVQIIMAIVGDRDLDLTARKTLCRYVDALASSTVFKKNDTVWAAFETWYAAL